MSQSNLLMFISVHRCSFVYVTKTNLCMKLIFQWSNFVFFASSSDHIFPFLHMMIECHDLYGTTHSYWWIAFGWAFQPAFAFAKAKSKRPKTHTYFCPKPVIEVDTSKLLFYCYTIEVWYHKWKIWAL